MDRKLLSTGLTASTMRRQPWVQQRLLSRHLDGRGVRVSQRSAGLLQRPRQVQVPEAAGAKARAVGRLRIELPRRLIWRARRARLRVAPPPLLLRRVVLTPSFLIVLVIFFCCNVAKLPIAAAVVDGRHPSGNGRGFFNRSHPSKGHTFAVLRGGWHPLVPAASRIKTARHVFCSTYAV